MLEVVTRTNVGIRRSINEDHLVASKPLGLFAVCDGMGGHAGGELASRLACETLEAFVETTRRGIAGPLPFELNPHLPPEANRLAMAIRVANREIYTVAQRNPALAGMGTTVASMIVENPYVHIAHVGDSRVYRWRGERLECLTRDHSALNELIDAGQLRPEEAYNFPEKNVITRALGAEPDVAVDVRVERLRDGDIYLLCTDGLTDHVSDRKLSELLAASWDREHGRWNLEGLGTKLIQLANQKGGRDNITLILVHHAD